MAIATKPKKHPHHKKRSAAHHKRSRRYMHTYFPYIPMLMIAGFGLWINAAISKPHVLGTSTDFSRTTLLTETNLTREDNAAIPLKLNPELTAAAQAKANDLVSRDYWAHTAPDGTTPSTLVASAGYPYQAAGENLAYGFGSASDIIKAWMNSPEHRRNLLSNKYYDIGFGIATSPNYLGKGAQTVVVAEYGEPVQATVGSVAFSGSTTDKNKAAAEIGSKSISRIAVLTGGSATWSYALVWLVAGTAIGVLLVRNSLRIHRLLSRGEEFVVKHPWLDISVVFVATACLLLSRTAGLIH